MSMAKYTRRHLITHLSEGAHAAGGYTLDSGVIDLMIRRQPTCCGMVQILRFDIVELSGDCTAEDVSVELFHILRQYLNRDAFSVVCPVASDLAAMCEFGGFSKLGVDSATSTAVYLGTTNHLVRKLNSLGKVNAKS